MVSVFNKTTKHTNIITMLKSKYNITSKKINVSTN